MEKKKIVLSDRRPVEIDPDLWPDIAHAFWHDGKVECQANRVAEIRVRAHDATEAPDSPRHPDGRVIVYGSSTAGPGGLRVGAKEPHAGFMLEPESGRETVSDDAIVRAIRRVAGVLADVMDADTLAAQCIADLPAEEV